MKKLLILICLLFLTGCTVNYEITLNDRGISEKITLIETNQSLFDSRNDSGWTLRESVEAIIENQNDEFAADEYTAKSLNNETQLGVEYQASSAKNLSNLLGINQCYTDTTLEISGSIVTFNTGSDFSCYEYYENLETIKIVLKTDYKVLSSNADSVDGNKYIWNITKDGNKQIEISYDNSVSKTANLILIISIILVIGIVCFAAYYVYTKLKKENKI